MNSDAPFSVHRASLVDAEATAAYNAILEQVAHPSPFLSVPAAEAATEAYGLGASIWLVFDEKDTPVAGLIAYEKKRGPFTALALPPLVPVSAPILAGSLRETDIHARRTPLDALLDALPYDQATLALEPRWTDVRTFQWAGWTLTPRYTYWIELDDDPLKHWSRSPRRLFRKESDNYTVREDPQATGDAVRMMQESYKRNRGQLSALPDHIRNHAEKMIRAGLARCFVTVNEKNRHTEAAVIVALNKLFAHSWLGGSDPGAARTVSYGSVLPKLSKSGVRTYDFTGANIAEIAEFKRQFGSTLVQGYRARRVSNPLLRAIEGFRR